MPCALAQATLLHSSLNAKGIMSSESSEKLSGNLPAASATYVYVSNAESNDIYVLRMDSQTGELRLLETVMIPGIVKSGMSVPLAVSPDKRFLFAATRGEPQSVVTFAIDQQSGKLKHRGSGPLSDSMPYIATDRTGRFLFAASYPGHKLTISPVNAQGIVQSQKYVWNDFTNAHAILPDAKNRYVLATTLGGDALNVFRFDAATGKIDPHDPPAVVMKPKTGPRHFIFHPKGRFVYVLGELDATIHVFDWDARKGHLKEKQFISALLPGTAGRIAAADLHITPDGKFLYSSERTSNTLAGFKVNSSDGTLSLIEFIATETQPRSFAIDSRGQYLFVVGQRSHQLTSYRIDSAAGKLSKLKQYPVGKNPSWLEIVDLPAK
jgi:6-phosphogluconolactonase